MKYSWSVLEVYLKYDSNTLEVCFKYTLEVYFQYIWSTLKVYFTLVRGDLLFATDKNGIQSSYPDDWAHHPGTFSKQHFACMTYSNASCTHCYLGHRQLYWLTLCMYTPSQSHQPATQTEWVCHDWGRTHHFGLRVQNLKNPIFMLGYLSLNALYSSNSLHRTNCFCLGTFQPILTQSFFPGICWRYSSSS